jgi:hypothetical protein
MSCRARIRGIPDIPAVREVNVRAGAQINQPLIFKAPVGQDDLLVLGVQPDAAGMQFNGQTYQWFKLRFPDGGEGWVRDDLLEITGDCAPFGYSGLSQYTFAFTSVREPVASPQSAPVTPPDTTEPTPQPSANPPAPAPVVETPDAPNASQTFAQLERVRKAAFSVTSAFEGHGYNAYQNYDRGIVSYGRFQFALTGGLPAVVQRYVSQSDSPVSDQLGPYLMRLNARDESLRHDVRLRDLLIAAADEQAMRDAQDSIATESYWEPVMEVSVRPRGIQSPLAIAMLFDIAIQYGVMHGLISTAETNLGVPAKSSLDDNGIREQQLILAVAQLRKRGLYAQAEAENLPGLRTRADFWLERISHEDWAFTGDEDGFVIVNGRRIQIRQPN